METTAAPPRSWGRADLLSLLAVTVGAAAVRLFRLADPSTLVFDETYYAKDACWYLEQSASLCGVNSEVTYVHPPLGKWLIALGIRLFGYDSFGWRISVAVAGTLCVVLLFLLARKLLGAWLPAAFAAGLLALDPLHFVQSRTSMLDIFVPMFGLAAVLFVVYDRDRLLRGPPDERGRVLDRPWRLAAGAAAGFAAAGKWSGAVFLLLVLALTLTWEISARRSVRRALRAEALSIAVALVLVPAAAYTLTYVGRLSTPVANCPEVQGSWTTRFVEVHECAFGFHRGLPANHSYQSPPWSWPLLKRPVSYFFETDAAGNYREIMATGNPFVWWAGLGALLVTGASWARRRGVGAPEGVILAGFTLTYGPWLLLGALSDRQAVFLFYFLPTVPFLCLALAHVAANIGWTWEAKAAVGLFAAGAVASFAFYYPVLAKGPLTRADWDKRIWVFDDCEKPGETPNAGTVGTAVTDENLPPPGWCWI